MAVASDGSKIYLGRGRAYFDRKDASGVKGGHRHFGTSEKFDISQAPEKSVVRDYGQASAPVLKEVQLRNEITIEMQLREYSRENLALALLGTAASYTQTSGTVTDENVGKVGSVALGPIFFTAARQISLVTVKKSPSTALVLGTDYEIADATVGMIRILPTSSTVVDGDTILVSYTKAAIASPGLEKVIGGTTPVIEGELRFVGDPAAGPSYDAVFWNVSIQPDGVLSLLQADEPGSMTLKATVLTDAANHPTEPNFVLVRKS